MTSRSYFLVGRALSDDFVSSLRAMLQNIQAVSLPFDSAGNVNLNSRSYTCGFAHRSIARMRIQLLYWHKTLNSRFDDD
jgi:hypothetical protein